jgi:hypothetical protein
MLKTYAFFTALLVCLIILPSHKADEGMFPLSHLKQVDLQAAGFKISEKDIYNPDGIALTDALVRLGGCTGSFVSAEGLIVTNHHCVFGAVAGLSTKENDYLENGFFASDKSKELKTSLTCKITKSYEDVSIKILDGVNLNMEPMAKKDIIRKNIESLQKEEQAKYPELSIEISEMFVGYSYTLFRYQILKDVRLAYVPPRTIGEFGGETDNWEWPKHTGDFSFVRAYVGKDGKPADYSLENVPYIPKKHLKINPKGSKNKDLVFILGYPGTTYRQEPYQFIQYQQQYVLPFVSNWYGFKMNAMETLGKDDRNRYLKLAGTIKQLANTKKNFEGKLFGLNQTGLLQIKTLEQEALKDKMKSKGVSTDFLNKIDSLYKIRLANAERDMVLNLFGRECNALINAIKIEKYISSNPKAGASNDTMWNAWRKKGALGISNNMLDHDLEQVLLVEMIKRAKALPKNQQVKSIQKIKNPEKWVKQAYEESYLDDAKQLTKNMDSIPWMVYKEKSKLRTLAKVLMPILKEIEDRSAAISMQLNNLMPTLLDARINYNQKKFIPDANSTLRFTYGYISAYKTGLNKHPEPYTQRKEIFEKNATDNIDYRLSPAVKGLLETENIAAELLDPETKDLVVCMLYNMDTTGGNSGSPVMDAEGNLVGVNFDRAYTATLNDYSWNADYSRSIAVDIRYVLFTMKYLNHADNLLSEMGINL